MFFPLVTLVSVIASSVASPIATKNVGFETCITNSTGQLMTADDDAVSFIDGKLALGGSLGVEFRPCYPNFGGFEPGSAGHLYVPALGQCISVNTPGVMGPYKVETRNCEESDDSRQIFTNFVQKDDGFYWSGSTMTDGSAVRNHAKDCPNGFWGPQIYNTTREVVLQCATTWKTVAFKLA